MRKSLIAAAAAAVAVLGVTAGPSVGAAASVTPHAFTTVWSDNFDGSNGSGVSGDNWKYDTGQGVFGTGEIERMTTDPANVHLDGAGNLWLQAFRDGGGNWTSGRIETQRDDFSAPSNGVLRMEARINLPSQTGAAGEGYWPAFWMMGEGLREGGSWPGIGEWDVMEDVNGQNLTYGTMHCGVSPGGPCNEGNGTGGNTSCPGSPCTGNWHTYAIEFDRSRSPEQLRWYVDGQQYFQLDSSQFDATTWNNTTHRGNFIILDLAIGGAFPNGVAGHGTPTGSTESSGAMLIDYVSVATSG